MTTPPTSLATSSDAERLLFEATMAKRSPGCDFSRFNKDNYTNRAVHNAWEGWQARAALPSPTNTGEGEPTDGWVSVAARVPKHEQNVLITGFQNNVPTNARYTAVAVFHRDGVFYDVDDGDDFYPPTHWMPLPTAPKAAEKSDGGANHG